MQFGIYVSYITSATHELWMSASESNENSQFVQQTVLQYSSTVECHCPGRLVCISALHFQCNCQFSCACILSIRYYRVGSSSSIVLSLAQRVSTVSLHRCVLKKDWNAGVNGTTGRLEGVTFCCNQDIEPSGCAL